MGEIIDRCRELRKNATEAERHLWEVLRDKQQNGYKFLRQYPIYVEEMQGRKSYFIADFYCNKARLVIEVDGGYHLQIKDEDENRDEVVAALGLRTIRFTNEEVLQTLPSVLQKINEVLSRTQSTG